MQYNKLTDEEIRVIENKGTEHPFTGKYVDNKKDGFYYCKKCNSKLFSSDNKFDSGTGWPSFDDEVDNSVKKIPDADGRRVEIVCANCGGHLGHIFEGEGLTPKNKRYCVNSISLNFKDIEKSSLSKAYFAGGCFWGVEYLFEKLNGVIEANSGYMGGDIVNPTYEDVCYKNSGHIEVVEVVYDSQFITYEDLVKYFFEIHDFTQTNGQGPDIGEQYKSYIFYGDSFEKDIAFNIIDILNSRGYKVATRLRELEKFYIAEEYHQNYYNKTKKVPYCHTFNKIF